jgi:hypothetical protein
MPSEQLFAGLAGLAGRAGSAGVGRVLVADVGQLVELPVLQDGVPAEPPLRVLRVEVDPGARPAIRFR